MGEILQFDYETEMKESFRDYAVSVIVGRALPDVRDGFKPVHRRILYAMKDLGITHQSPHKKSARIVGEVIGKYHPHGDSAVYETMVKMAQDFRQTLPLVDGHGNFGSMDGDAPAAMRYTEARLSPISSFVLQDLEKDVVDFRDNYDSSEKEPSVLPVRYPNLLVNGTFGIAVGMQSNIPPHNVEEVLNAFLHLLKKPKATIDELMDYLPAPDFPTGGILTNPEEIKNFYRTGEAKAVIRAKIDVEPSTYGKTNVIITEIPFTIAGNKAKFVNDLTMMVIDKKLNEVVDVRDESSKDGIRIVLEVKKGVDIPKFLQKLYAKTKCQDTTSYKFLALVDGTPVVLTLLDYLQHYLVFQKEITRRKYQYLYEKGQVQKEIVDGLLEAIQQIDVIIEVIRGSSNVTQMKNCLMYGETKGIPFKLKKYEKVAQGFSFTERQTKAILEMKLQRLGALEKEELLRDAEELEKRLEEYYQILTNEKALLKVIQKDHEHFKKQFATPRKTILQEEKTVKYVEEERVETVRVCVDRFGYIKTIEPISISQEEAHLFKITFFSKSNERLLVFTNKGNVYQVKCKDIPKGKVKDKGITIHSLAKLEREEIPLYVTDKERVSKETLLFVTKKGLTKRVSGSEFLSNRTKLQGTKLEDGDELCFIQSIQPNESEVLFQSKLGYIARMKVVDFPEQNKNAKGVCSLKLKEKDALEHIQLLKENESQSFVVNGQICHTTEIPLSNRGVAGKKISR